MVASIYRTTRQTFTSADIAKRPEIADEVTDLLGPGWTPKSLGRLPRLRAEVGRTIDRYRGGSALA